MKLKKIIGYTAGVFDLFHIGHLNILKHAKSQCDHLIVGVTTDELSLAKKNKTPVIPYSERIEIVKAISYVDQVVPQTDLNKMEAYHQYHFNILFVGDDWKGDQRWLGYEKELAIYGAKVVYLPYTKHTSSTLLREVLNKIYSSKSNTQSNSFFK